MGGLSVVRLEPWVPVGLGSPEQTPGTDTQPCLDAHGGPSSSIKEEPEVVLIRDSSPHGSAPGPFVSAAFTALDREARLGGTSPEALCPTRGPPHPHPCIPQIDGLASVPGRLPVMGSSGSDPLPCPGKGSLGLPSTQFGKKDPGCRLLVSNLCESWHFWGTRSVLGNLVGAPDLDGGAGETPDGWSPGWVS